MMAEARSVSQMAVFVSLQPGYGPDSGDGISGTL